MNEWLNIKDLQMFGPELLQIWVCFTHLKMWVTVARHNFKWVKMLILNVMQLYKGQVD